MLGSPQTSAKSQQPARRPVAFRIFSHQHAPDRLVPAINREMDGAPFNAEIVSICDRPLEGMMVERAWAGLDVSWVQATPIRVARRGPVLAAGSDSLLFAVAGSRTLNAFGRDTPLAAGEGYAIGNCGTGGVAYTEPFRQVAVIVPQAALRPLVREKSPHFVQRVAPDNGAMRLLTGYLEALKDADIPPELEQSIVAHVHDLLAVTLGPTRDGLELAKNRGIRAARLHAIKKDIMKGLGGTLAIEPLATGHGLTARYVQMLFEGEGTTFTTFVRERRLARARAMLASPRFDHLRIGEIALEVGFNDLSYFIRAFTKRYGMSPRDAREEGRAPRTAQ